MKKFKLVPLKHFENLISGKEICSDQETNSPSEKQADNRRILKDVMEQNEVEINENDINIPFHYVTDMKNTPLKGGEDKQKNIPIFLPDAAYLPEYSRGRNLRKSYDDMSDILYSKDIPDEIKIKLYHIFRDKYENVRKPVRINMESGIQSDTENESDNNSRILERILARLPENKQELGSTVGDILYNDDMIKWSKYGYITSPPTPREQQMDLNKLLKILIYRNTGTQNEIDLVYSIVKPIFNILEPYILNRKLIKKHDESIQNKRLTKYVAWSDK